MITPTEISQRFVEIYYKMYGMRMVKNKTEFCSKVGLFPSNFVQIERGERQASLAQICALIDAYKVSPEWLFTGKGDIFRILDE